MSSPVRITAGLLAAAAVCAAAAGIGWAVGPLERDTAEPEHAREAMALPEGLAVAADGYRLDVARTTVAAGRPRGALLPHRRRRPAARHRVRARARAAHAPDRRAPRPHRLPAPAPDHARRRHVGRAGGDARARALPRVRRLQDRRPNTTLGVDLVVAGRADSQPLPAPADTATAGAYAGRARGAAARRGEEGELALPRHARRAAGRRSSRYLGARGHLVALREGDLAYLHDHPPTTEAGGRLREHVPERRPLPRCSCSSRWVASSTAAFTVEVTR